MGQIGQGVEHLPKKEMGVHNEGVIPAKDVSWFEQPQILPDNLVEVESLACNLVKQQFNLVGVPIDWGQKLRLRVLNQGRYVASFCAICRGQRCRVCAEHQSRSKDDREGLEGREVGQTFHEIGFVVLF